MPLKKNEFRQWSSVATNTRKAKKVDLICLLVEIYNTFNETFLPNIESETDQALSFNYQKYKEWKNIKHHGDSSTKVQNIRTPQEKWPVSLTNKLQNEEKEEGELKDKKRPKRQINQMQTEEFVWILIQANKQLDKQNEKGKFETVFLMILKN